MLLAWPSALGNTAHAGFEEEWKVAGRAFSGPGYAFQAKQLGMVPRA